MSKRKNLDPWGARASAPPGSATEIDIVIRQLKANKAPGTDGLGLPIEFYRTFWNEIKIIVYYLYQEWLQKGTMNRSAKRGIISLLEKKPGKDPLMLENWRPLNVDYKIFAKLLGNRLQTVIPSLVHKEQIDQFTKSEILRDFTVFGVPNKEMHTGKWDFRHF